MLAKPQSIASCLCPRTGPGGGGTGKEAMESSRLSLPDQGLQGGTRCSCSHLSGQKSVTRLRLSCKGGRKGSLNTFLSLNTLTERQALHSAVQPLFVLTPSHASRAGLCVFASALGISCAGEGGEVSARKCHLLLGNQTWFCLSESNSGVWRLWDVKTRLKGFLGRPATLHSCVSF